MLRFSLILSALLAVVLFGCSDESAPVMQAPVERSVSIETPVNSAVVSEKVNVVANVAGGAVNFVRFHFDGFSPTDARCDTAPYSYVWDVTEYADSTNHNVFAVAHFADLETLYSDTVTVTVDNSTSRPESVVMEIPNDVTYGSFTLTWQLSGAVDFESYKVFGSDDPGVTPQSDLIATVDNKDSTSMAVTHPADNYTRYYKVFVFDIHGLNSGSNEIEATTLNAAPPTPVLYEVTELGDNEVFLLWSAVDVLDFRQYDIERKESGSSFQTIESVLTVEDTTYIDRSVDGPQDYVYRITVADTGDSTGMSNEMSVTVSDPRPSVAELVSLVSNSETKAEVIWRKCPDPDFNAYRLYRSENAGVDESSDLVYETAVESDTSFIDTSVYPGGEYYYRLYVWDNNGFSRSSIPHAVSVLDEDPEPVSLSFCSTAGDSNVCLVWSKSTSRDFSHYRICRSSEPGVSETSPTLGLSHNIDDSIFVDTGVDSSQVWYYAVIVYDASDNSTTSNEVRAERANHALAFDGNDDWVTVPYSHDLDLQSGFTIEMWFWAESTAPQYTDMKLLIKEYDYDAAYCVDFKSNYIRGYVNFGHNQCLYYWQIPTETWIHVAYTYDGLSSVLYVDGQQVAYNSVAVSVPVESTDIYIGGRPRWNPQALFHGVIDEIRIWNHPRSTAEIASTMFSHLNGSEEGLVVYFDCNAGQGQLLEDITGRGNDSYLGETLYQDDHDAEWVESTAPVTW